MSEATALARDGGINWIPLPRGYLGIRIWADDEQHLTQRMVQALNELPKAMVDAAACRRAGVDEENITEVWIGFHGDGDNHRVLTFEEFVAELRERLA